jgi:hypothetical protein
VIEKYENSILPPEDIPSSPNLPIDNIRSYQIAGLTIQVRADLPINDQTFHPKFKPFEIPNPVKPDITLFHHFALPEIRPSDLGQRIYQSPPWAIYRRDDSWLYLGILEDGDAPTLLRIALFSLDHARGRIFSPGPDIFIQGNVTSLSLLPTDQIILARVLADYLGCFFHAAGMILNAQGFLFAGHSDAGKSTITTILQDEGEILCDDRIVIRDWPEGFKIHGTWSHGDIPTVSPASAPLRALFFLEQASTNQLIPMNDRREVIRRIFFLVIKPLVTADWWEKTLTLIEKIAQEVPCYVLKFDKSGEVKYVIRELLES